MKKLLIIIALFFTMINSLPALCKGTINEGDAFTTYIGRSKSDVQKIAPLFKEYSQGFLLDKEIGTKKGQNIYLLAKFDDNNIADTVLVIIYSDTKLDRAQDFILSLDMLGVDFYRSDTDYTLFNNPETEEYNAILTDDYLCMGTNEVDSDGENVFNVACTVNKEMINSMSILYYLYRQEQESETIEASSVMASEHEHEDDTWTCENGHSGNTGNFCSECGAKKPERMKCPVCGYEPPIDEKPLFCQECGARFDQSAITQPEPTKTPKPAVEPRNSVTATPEKSDSGIVDPDLKAFCDSYEAYMDKYVDFMKKYNANPTDMSLFLEYTSMLSELEEFSEAADRYDETSSEMSAADLAYYMATMTRINTKMMSIY